MIDLAYEGSSAKLVVPTSTFGGLVPCTDLVSDNVAKYKPDNANPALVESKTTEAGYAKGSNEYWSKGGPRITTPNWSASCLGPLGPVLEQQCRDVGFDIPFRINAHMLK